MRYTKYKKLYKVSSFGNNDEWRARTESQYRTPGVSFINGKTCRFNLNGAFNDANLSKKCTFNFRISLFSSGYKYECLCKFKNSNKL